jgi:hypothetical protein
MKKSILFLFIMSAWFTPIFGQNENESKKDRVEAYKIAFITEKLHLTPKEAAAFWPLYNEYSDKMVGLRNKECARAKTFTTDNTPTDAEAELFIKEHLAYKDQQAELTRKYVAEFKKILPLSKVAKLVTLEQEFKMQLLQHYKEKKAYPTPTH